LIIVTVRLQPIGSAPHLTQRIFKLSTNQRFETIVRFLRRKLGVKEHESVFCYVGSVFAPALDEGVGNLWTVSLLNGMRGEGVWADVWL
jgi:ubiquitin-like protein ATG12